MKRPALRVLVLLGVVYFLAGMLFGALAGRAANHGALVAWRWAAWLVSAIAFGAHILYEQRRLRNPPRIAALHVAAGAALGAFGLAIAANVHAQMVVPHRHAWLLVLSLAIWPLMTALPAFIVALCAAVLVARVRPP